MIKVYTITEYNSFINADISYNEYIPMSENHFNSLENFILRNPQISDFLSISFKKRFGKVITVKNYVGILSINDNLSIEILPKVYSYQNDISYTKKVFFNMLKTIKDIPFKSFQKTFLQVDKIPMLDIFISEFLISLENLIKVGLKNDYSNKIENGNFLKGKLDFPKQIKYNTIHKEKFYFKRDVFSMDCLENRLIKSTLMLLLNYTDNYKSLIKRYLYYFQDVKISQNIKKDILSYSINSKNAHYKDILKWCEVFLTGNGFTSFIGDNYSYALLFPMQKIFESYVSSLVMRASPKEYSIKLQDKSFYLIDTPNNQFSIIPDVVLHCDTKTIILDAKWKLLHADLKNYGISQQDMYQMYVYAKKYHADMVYMIYPLSDDKFIDKDITFKTENITIKIEFIRL